MGFTFPTRLIREGAAEVLVPEIEPEEGEHIDHARSRSPVFYNPVMRLNRDTAVLALAAHQRRLGKPVEACEPMCGSGVRGIRLTLEVEEVGLVVMGDWNPVAVRLAEKNASLNGVTDRIRVRRIEANLLLRLHEGHRSRFDYVDIDPYGSPAEFLDSAVAASKNNGMLALTATDMAPLCGVNPRACLRKYGGTPLRTNYCHEVALRLLAGALVRVAAVHEVATIPVFSYYADHYVRLYAVLRRGARRADRALGEMGYILHCPRCSHRKAVKARSLVEASCEACGSEMSTGGPLWLGELAEADFCGEMLDLAEGSGLGGSGRLMELIGLVRGEVGYPPTFIDVDEVSSRLGKSLDTHHPVPGRPEGSRIQGREDPLRREGGQDGRQPRRGRKHS